MELQEQVEQLTERIAALESALTKLAPGVFQKQKRVIIDEPMIVRGTSMNGERSDYTGPRRVFLFGKYRFVDGDTYPTEEECEAMDLRVREAIKTDDCISGATYEYADTEFRRKEKVAMNNPEPVTRDQRKSWLWTGG